jgi:anti-sigma-K factor RskA
MSVHEQFADDLALYALGALEGEDRASLEAHLEGCASCRRELEQLRGDAAMLALSTVGPKPPARSKARLMNAIAEEPRREAKARANVALWWAGLGWVVAALAIIAGVTLWRQNVQLKTSAIESVRFFERQRLESEKQRRVADILQAPDATGYDILPVKYPAPPPSGKAIYSRERGLVFIASNLKSVPSKKAYELWLIPKQGAPIPAGVFKPDSRGSATVINPPLPAGVEAKAFAITIEPEQGSSTPTMPIVMVGSGG